MNDLHGKHIAILGAGRSGLGAARLARAHGAAVTLFDEAEADKLGAALQRVRAEGFEAVVGAPARALDVTADSFAEAILSPGLAVDWPLPAKFAAAGIPLVGELEFAYRYVTGPIVGITGTNGKSTCTELVAAILNGCGKASLPCGNHGVSLSEVLASGEKYDVLAVEISSFQLETIQTFRADAAIWLNFAPDHLDRYPGMAEYFAAKARIFQNATAGETAIVRAGETVDSGAARRVTFSAYGAEANYTWQRGEFFKDGLRIGGDGGIRLRGRHNMENVLAAIAACHTFGLEFEAMFKALADYEPPRHRCELVREWNGLEFINDSKATNLHALEACLGALDRPLVLIAGGKEKHLDYSPLRASLAGSVRAMVLIGEIAGQLRDTFSDLVPCRTARSMREAVAAATALASPGDAVVLSPGTSSFDMYTGYAQRGDDFRMAVLDLA